MPVGYQMELAKGPQFGHRAAILAIIYDFELPPAYTEYDPLVPRE